MKKKVLALSMAAVLAMSALTGCGGGDDKSSGGDGDKVKSTDLRMNITTPETGTWMNGAQSFADKIKERTNGKYTISIYPNEQLSNGDQGKGVEMVVNGSTDVDIHSTIIWSALNQKLTVVNMPWLITSYEQADELFTGEAGQAINDIMKDIGVVPLAFGESGFRQLTNSKREVTKPEDLKGLKIRVPGIAMYIDLFKELGADPTAMNWGETFTALQQGAVDGQENPLDVAYTGKMQEVQKYLTNWNYSYDLLVLSVSQKTWDKLTDDEKKIFQDTATEAMELQKKDARKANADYKSKMVEAGMQSVDLTPEQIEVFKAKAAPIYDKYKDTIGEDLYQKFGYTK